MLSIPGSEIRLPARAVETRPTRDPAAWIAPMITVELYAPIDVARMADLGSRPGLRPGALLNDWFAIAAAVGTPAEFAQRHSIPPRGNARAAKLTHVAFWRLQPGTLLNVGRCAPYFGAAGGGFQAEFLGGPLPTLRSASRLGT